MRFGLKDVHELPSMEEFETLVAESFQSDMLAVDSAATEVVASNRKSVSSPESPASTAQAPLTIQRRIPRKIETPAARVSRCAARKSHSNGATHTLTSA